MIEPITNRTEPGIGANAMHLQTFDQAIDRLREIIEQCQIQKENGGNANELIDHIEQVAFGKYDTLIHTNWT